MRIELPAVVLACTLAACGAKVDRADVREGGISTAATPGLSLELRSVEVADGAYPIVTFRATDGAGTPLDLVAEIAAGAIAPRFTLARVASGGAYAAYLVSNVAARPYVDSSGVRHEPAGSATQAVAEPPEGAPWPVWRLVAQGDGVYAYLFGTTVSGVDPQATHLAGVFATRSVGGSASASATLDFVPAGGTPAPREVVDDAACGSCHTVIEAHDARRGVKLCLTCHTSQSSDPETGNPLDLRTLVHKIHSGARLANDWTVVGADQVLYDWSHVVMAPSHSTSFSLVSPSGAAAVSDPGIVRNCTNCHQGADADRHATTPTAAACGSCHDAIDFTTGAGHVYDGGPQPATDADCASCHVGASSRSEITKVHSERYETTRGLLFDAHTLDVRIVAVNGAISGGSTAPTVDFTIALDGSPYDIMTNQVGGQTTPGQLSSLSFQLAGPVTDYAGTWSGGTSTSSAATALLSGKGDPSKVTVLGPGSFRFKFPAAIPAGKTGVYVASFESYWRQTLTAANGNVIAKPYAANPVFRGDAKNVVYFDVATGLASEVERRKITSTAKCNSCHEDIGFHGSRARKGIDYCATCHNPNLDNAGRARFQPSDTAVQSFPAIANFPTTPVFVVESVASRVYIHRIHMGAALPSVKAGGVMRLGANGSSVSDFSQFVLPGGIQGRCTKCHDGETYALPTVDLLPVKRSVYDCGVPDASGWCTARTLNTTNGFPGAIYIPPLKAVCTSCHDDEATKAHADLHTVQPMTAGAVETCGGCHGAGKDFDALKVHAAP